MPRLFLAPEGQLSATGHGYDPEALTWRATTPIMADGEVVGMATISRTEHDGQSWLVADAVFEDEPVDAVSLEVDAALERFEVTEGRPAHWVESGVISRLVAADAPDFEAPDTDGYRAEAAAVLENFQEDDDDEDDDMDDDAGGMAVEGVVVVEGTSTGDDRMIEAGALTWDTLPIPIIWDREDSDHTGTTVGRIDAIERRGNEIWATGQLSESEDEETVAAVLRVTELLEEGAVGVSVSLDSESAEIRVSAEAIEREEEAIDAIEDGEVPEVETDDEGNVIVARWESGEEMYVVTSARIRHVAIVDTPAFAEAKLTLVAGGYAVPGGSTGYLIRSEVPVTAAAAEPDDEGETVTAHAAAATMDFDAPPAAWFEMEEPDESDPRVVWVNDEGAPCEAGSEGGRPWGVPLTVTAEGQVYGHLASWQDCHTGFEDRCVTPPRSNSGYAWFHTGTTDTDDGPVSTGRITVDTSHAPHRMNAAGAVAHYDQTGHAVADVAVSDGELGPWMTGWVRPWATAQQRHELTAHPPSGDWRPRGGSTELIGVLAVNVAGFPMPRSVATYRAGELASLVASGMPPVLDVPPEYQIPDAVLDRLSRLEARIEAEDVLKQLESV